MFDNTLEECKVSAPDFLYRLFDDFYLVKCNRYSRNRTNITVLRILQKPCIRDNDCTTKYTGIRFTNV